MPTPVVFARTGSSIKGVLRRDGGRDKLAVIVELDGTAKWYEVQALIECLLLDLPTRERFAVPENEVIERLDAYVAAAVVGSEVAHGA